MCEIYSNYKYATLLHIYHSNFTIDTLYHNTDYLNMIPNIYLNMNRGDWKCICGYLNYNIRTQCCKCKRSRSSQSKPKDWPCQCGEINFGYRTECRKCSRNKSGDPIINNNIVPKPGDWTCDCGDLNFASRVQCRRCTKLKPGELLQQNNDSLLCKICFDAPLQARLKTCGHLSTCTVCALQITSCPVCRTKYNPDTDIEPTYIS